MMSRREGKGKREKAFTPSFQQERILTFNYVHLLSLIVAADGRVEELLIYNCCFHPLPFTLYPHSSPLAPHPSRGVELVIKHGGDRLSALQMPFYHCWYFIRVNATVPYLIGKNFHHRSHATLSHAATGDRCNSLNWLCLKSCQNFSRSLLAASAMLANIHTFSG